VGVAALLTFKRIWICFFAMSFLKKLAFVPYHAAIISATIVSLDGLQNVALIRFAVLVDNLVIISP
jgi:hypothetical protein